MMASKNKNSTQKPVKKYINLLYVTPSEITARDLSDLLKESSGIAVELWESMNTIELELPNQNSIDIEPLKVSDFKTPSDASFVRNRGIKTIFTINLCETDLNTITQYFEQIVEKHSGFLCADSEDFTPVYAGSSKK